MRDICLNVKNLVWKIAFSKTDIDFSLPILICLLAFSSLRMIEMYINLTCMKSAPFSGEKISYWQRAFRYRCCVCTKRRTVFTDKLRSLCSLERVLDFLQNWFCAGDRSKNNISRIVEQMCYAENWYAGLCRLG